MRLWQKGMIVLAQNKLIKDFIQHRASLSKLAIRFIGGRDALEVIANAQALNNRGLKASLFYLGEYVDDPIVINQTITTLKTLIKGLATLDLDMYISIDPTQIGYQINEEMCRKNAFEIAHEINQAIRDTSHSTKHFLMLDMEDSSVTEATIKLYESLIEASLPVALTLQAYLFRTKQDLQNIVSKGGVVRLVKGAFAESKHIAFTTPSKIDDSYMDLATIMLSDEAKQNGFYPIFATHDDRLIDTIIQTARKQGWQKGEYEFEMLRGVRSELQEKLIAEGEKVRLYLPFGTDWWPYVIRRVGESPKNAKFLLKLLLGGS